MTLDTCESKAGASKNEGLRKLAADLYTKASDLASAVSSGVSHESAANNLANAVGDKDQTGSGKPDTLRQALNQLGTAPPGASDLTDKAKAVKDKYSNFISGGVKQKYNAVVKQKTAGKYTQGKGQTEYDKVVDAWNSFNDLYHDSISTEKFCITVIASIITQWSDLSPQTKYVYHGTNRTNNGFHGWTEYIDHQGNSNDHTGATAAECKDPLPPGKGTHVPVHAWIWDFLLYR